MEGEYSQENTRCSIIEEGGARNVDTQYEVALSTISRHNRVQYQSVQLKRLYYVCGQTTLAVEISNKSYRYVNIIMCNAQSTHHDRKNMM